MTHAELARRRRSSSLVVFVLVPWGIAATGRRDFYYTLTSVALLAIASAGVWLTFYIGRINIGQGAYCADRRLRLRDPRHHLRRLVLVDAAARRPLLRRR